MRATFRVGRCGVNFTFASLDTGSSMSELHNLSEERRPALFLGLILTVLSFDGGLPAS